MNHVLLQKDLYVIIQAELIVGVAAKMFVNSTPHRRFTQSLGLPLSAYEILDFTLEKYGHELSVNGSTPYLFSVEPDGTAMRL